MSEEQKDYDTDTQPTPGPWRVISYNIAGHGGHDHTVDMAGADCRIASIEHAGETGRKNADLIAAAGTAAQEAKEMGYDPVEAVEDTPKQIFALERCRRYFREQYRAGKIGSLRSSILSDVEDALASAEGSNDD